MERIPLTAETRTASGSGDARRLRRTGRVPGVVYGRGSDPKVLSVDEKELMGLLKTAAGSALLIDLTLSGNGQQSPLLCLVKEVQRHPVTRGLLNVDFLSISLTEQISVTVHIVGEGEAVGVENSGGILEQNLRSLSISCLPTAIPDEIRVDISGLEIGDSLHVSDLPIPEGVTVEADESEVVFRVSAPSVVEDEAAEGEGELAEGEAAAEGAADGEEGEEEGEKD
ncbi:MAG: 50S ribosomal protein L25 [Armatimonadetes bacterium CG_4_10_14_3_um_filter_66_18]|nr:50S ribosomal protein L25 [Armatimonadota bacterium]OIP04210.1 MAG: hypothetical protein AUJ96_13315 [Armatimonadetes bacterium CG2_30_66_41]PIU91875.1 MAG: 50S ribosomal protein L25 [Armatimonadetes bacterium CG06_land_8_20_14_3_00_66_21]PIW20877.1 MAG: 50S ribosomal protein L25 [Armatimonadetes bacterium CG17_big_fil_post_rev_8_21_14_2_50_66_6]PIX37298.1 MAG: 50S ribosomal protein L25 [Armatimonadetes bacterium CG_4_8_14_3_um_filter_66_20]PIY48240.1 MAG: 50S ribosomal protein L25 [Armatim